MIAVEITANHVLGAVGIISTLLTVVAVTVAIWNARRMAQLTSDYVTETRELVRVERERWERETDENRQRIEAERRNGLTCRPYVDETHLHPPFAMTLLLVNTTPRALTDIELLIVDPPDIGLARAQNVPGEYRHDPTNGLPTGYHLPSIAPQGVLPLRFGRGLTVGSQLVATLTWVDDGVEYGRAIQAVATTDVA